jgi:hypothetical protein
MANSKKILLSIAFIFAAVLLISGCSINKMVRETYFNESPLKIRDIDIDESEVESIKALEAEMEKGYDVKTEISSIADELNNPFEPFYIGQEDEDETNILILKSIYFEDGAGYCELKFNDFTYLLMVGDVFNETYMVQSINESSVIILKGDEILTLLIDEMIQD